MSLTKLTAAECLLDAAIARLLDKADAVSAIVLAGSAEDVLEGLLEAEGRESEAARNQQADAILRLLRQFKDGTDKVLAFKGACSQMRFVFNWLRHADSEDDPPTLDSDIAEEARETIDRAIYNLYALEQRLPARVRDFDRRRRGSQPTVDLTLPSMPP